jgi:hypothetical protein
VDFKGTLIDLVSQLKLSEEVLYSFGPCGTTLFFVHQFQSKRIWFSHLADLEVPRDTEVDKGWGIVPKVDAMLSQSPDATVQMLHQLCDAPGKQSTTTTLAKDHKMYNYMVCAGGVGEKGFGREAGGAEVVEWVDGGRFLRWVVEVRLDGSSVTDVGVQALAAGCAGLVAVKLDWCTGVTDVGVQELAAGCVGLVTAELNGCTGVTDVGVQALAAGYTGLEAVRWDGRTGARAGRTWGCRRCGGGVCGAGDG